MAAIDKYFQIKRKVVEVDDEQARYLGKIAELFEIVEKNRGFWRYTHGTVTLERLAAVDATLARIAAAIKAEDFRLERFAAAVLAPNTLAFKDFPKAIRCPTTDDRQIQADVKQARLALRNGLVELVHGLYEMCQGSRAAQYTNFIQYDKPSLLAAIKQEAAAVEAVNVDEDFVDPAAEIKVQGPPAGMYQ